MNSKALYQQLADDSDVTDIVDTRIYHDAPPKDPTTPYIVFRNITSVQINAVGYMSDRWMIRLIGSFRKANESSDLDTLKDAVLANLTLFRGELGSGANTQVVKQVELNMVNSNSVNNNLLKDHKQKQVSLDFLFHYLR